jgi:formylglycine-generating enzyme required for sulfatase activity
MKNYFFCRLGLIILTLSLALLGCETPTETTYTDIPVEKPIDFGNGCECDHSCISISETVCTCCKDIPEDDSDNGIKGAETVVAGAIGQEVRVVQGVSFKMRYVPAGTFAYTDPMGWDMGNEDIEVPILTGFWMAETEITQEFYETFMGNNPSLYKDNPAPGERQSQRPVESVTFYEAVLFCNYLSIASGREPVYHIWGIPDWERYLKWAISSRSHIVVDNIYVDKNANGYRLPTAEEWIWAAIGADTQSPGQVNNTGLKKLYSGGPIGSWDGVEYYSWRGSSITHEVGKKLGNELGIFDMTGNVFEWLCGSVMGGSLHYTGNASRLTPFVRLETLGFRIVSNN